VDVVEEGTLAILRIAAEHRPGASLFTSHQRADVVRAARDCGFTHVALELREPGAADPEPGVDANVRRAEPLA
jgi:hypothetical protein